MEPSDLKFVKINQYNQEIFENLAQAYEAEFSNITKKLPNESGLFKIDIAPEHPWVGYLLFCQKKAVGFCVANVENEIKDIAEFYIVPVMRKKNLGYKLAIKIFNKHPGKWQVRQIKEAIDARFFWQNIIKKYTKNKYEELEIQDEQWGIVTCQRFQTIAND